MLICGGGTTVIAEKSSNAKVKQNAAVEEGVRFRRIEGPTVSCHAQSNTMSRSLASDFSSVGIPSNKIAYRQAISQILSRAEM